MYWNEAPSRFNKSVCVYSYVIVCVLHEFEKVAFFSACLLGVCDLIDFHD